MLDYVLKNDQSLRLHVASTNMYFGLLYTVANLVANLQPEIYYTGTSMVHLVFQCILSMTVVCA